MTPDTRHPAPPNSSNAQLRQIPTSPKHKQLQEVIRLERANQVYNMAPPTITEDYYSTLGVDQTATLELITKAYRRLALTLHPDRGGSTQAFQLLGLAYETLNDETKRRAYDQI